MRARNQAAAQILVASRKPFIPREPLVSSELFIHLEPFVHSDEPLVPSLSFGAICSEPFVWSHSFGELWAFCSEPFGAVCSEPFLRSRSFGAVRSESHSFGEPFVQSHLYSSFQAVPSEPFVPSLSFGAVRSEPFVWRAMSLSFGAVYWCLRWAFRKLGVKGLFITSSELVKQ